MISDVFRNIEGETERATTLKMHHWSDVVTPPVMTNLLKTMFPKPVLYKFNFNATISSETGVGDRPVGTPIYI